MEGQNRKQKLKSPLLRLIFSLLIAGVIFSVSGLPQVLAQSVNDLQQQLANTQAQLKALNDQIGSYQSQIKTLQGKTNTLKNQISILNLQIQSTQTQISITQNQINATNIEIADVTNQIVQTQKQIAQEKTILKGLIGDINQLDQQSPLEIALANDNFSQYLDQVQYDNSVQQQSQDALVKIQQLESDLSLRQADLKTEQATLTTQQEELTNTQNNLNSQKNAKNQLLAQTKGQETAYQKLLADSQEQQTQLADQVNDLDNQIAAKLGNNKLSAQHGLLAWPMDGTITQGYGKTGFTALGYNFHNGLDIASSAGTPIHAAGDGTVIATGNTTPSGEDGAYGNWVAIKHDTGKFAAHPIITLYGHMRNFIVSKGQTVGVGQTIGFEGNTGNTTRILYGPTHGYHLHFTVFDASGFGITAGAYPRQYGGSYTVPYGATYNPLDFL